MRNVEKIIVLLLLIAAVSIPACSQKEVIPTDKAALQTLAMPGAVKTSSGLVYVDLVKGTGVSPTPGKPVAVHYTGWLEDGTMFETTLDRHTAFSFITGRGQVIEGMDEGIMSMKVGGKRKLVIPPDLAYGSSGSGSIPPNATLIFEVELIDAAK